MCIIRPFVSTEEKQIRSFVKRAALPVIKSPCPSDKDSQRAYMKEYLFRFEKEHRGLYQRIVGALRRGEIDGWKE
jgi:tRNA(Ile)-lysidine synthase TilS/MesJ